MIRKIGIYTCLAALMGLQPAKAVTLSLVGAGTLSRPVDNLATNYNARLGVGAGALLEFSVGQTTGLEFGALYLQRRVGLPTAVDATNSTVTSTMLEFPLLLRFPLLSFLSIGAGGYYAKYRGEIRTETTTGATTVSSTSSYDSAQRKNHDYGLVANASLHVPLVGPTQFVVDGRYSYGLLNNTLQPESRLKFRDMCALIGLRLGI